MMRWKGVKETDTAHLLDRLQNAGNKNGADVTG